MKNKFVKQFILFPLLLLIITILSISVYASGNVEFSADDIVTFSGETITVPIRITNNSGFVSASLEVSYDEIFTLVDVVDTGLIKGGYHTTDYSEPYYLTWRDDNKSSNYTSKGIIVNLMFEVSESAKPGKYVLSIAVHEDGVLDNMGSPVDVGTDNGVIEIATQECSHEWSKWSKNSNTKHKRSCKICSESEYERHDWGDGEVTKKPTATSDGIVTYTCDSCSGTKTEYIPALEPESYTISGTVTSYGDAEETVTVILYDADGTEIDSDTTTDGTYSLSAPDGTYTLEVSKLNHVTREYEVTVDGDEVTQDVKIHLIGDINGDGKVNSVDKKTIYNHINEVNTIIDEYGLKVADVNGDSKINSVDKKLIYNHINEISSLWSE